MMPPLADRPGVGTLKWRQPQFAEPGRRSCARVSEDRDMSYVLSASSSPSFVLTGLKGYEFGPLKDPDFAVHLVKVHKGHDTFIVSKALTRIYYIVEGEGHFRINDQNYDVARGQLVEVPPGVEYSYSGSMEILLVSYPRWFEGNEQETRINPDVVSNSSARGRLRHLRNTLRLVKSWARRCYLMCSGRAPRRPLV